MSNKYVYSVLSKSNSTFRYIDDVLQKICPGGGGLNFKRYIFTNHLKLINIK